jgi:uncharacterized membrane protein YraQ (UPF0718 family)
MWPVIKASLFGVPLPLCSCSVIPVATSLRRHGSSKGATIAFLLSTPQTGVDSIMATFGLLGPVFAVFRPLAAFAAGVLGGGIAAADTAAQGDGQPADPCADECCCAHGRNGSRLRRMFRYGFTVLPGDIARPLLIGLIVAGVVSAAVPQDFFAEALGTGLFAMMIMMFLGIPVYVCATASIPVAAAMIMKGATPGAALVFLMTGPATNAATIATLWKVLGRRTTLIYLAVVAATALGAGLLLDYFFTVSGITPGHAHAGMLPPWFKALSALTLLGVLCANIIAPLVGKRVRRQQ